MQKTFQIYFIDAREYTLEDVERGLMLALPGCIPVISESHLTPVTADDSPVAPECNHLWLHNVKKGWKVCNKCGERRSIR